MKNIVTLTLNPSIDTCAEVPNVVDDDKLRCGPARHEPGGGGINVSRALQRLQGHAKTLYFAGGFHGQLLSAILDEEKLDHQPIPIKQMTRQNVIITETATNRQYRFNLQGPHIQTDEWQNLLHRVTNLNPKPDYLVASGSLPPGVPDDFYAQLAKIAQQNNTRFVLDTSGNPLKLALEAGVFLVKPNIRELQLLNDAQYHSEDDTQAFAQKLIQQNAAQIVAVSLGAAGVLVATQQGLKRLHTPAVPIQSRVGAGDSMVAGITLALAQGHPLDHALRYGTAAGTAAVMTPGIELCRLQDTQNIFQKITLQNCP